MVVSDLREIIKSRVCPCTCVACSTCYTSPRDSNRSENFVASLSSTASTRMLKSLSRLYLCILVISFLNEFSSAQVKMYIDTCAL